MVKESKRGFSLQPRILVKQLRILPREVLRGLSLLMETNSRSLMIDHNVGVSIEKTYEIKRVDSDYFAEDPE